MKRLVQVLLAVLCVLMLDGPLFAAQADVQVVADWIKALQYTDSNHPDSLGAIKIHHTPGHIGSDGYYYYRVVPYHSNLAVLGLLDTSIHDKLVVAERWIQWYLDHIDPGGTPPGVIYDHWYQADGSGESTCPPGLNPAFCQHDDASDSYAATFLGVVMAYYEQGGSTVFLNAQGNKEKLETIAGVISGLQDSDGLTWAKGVWPVKYLMDNSEVYWGLTSMAKLEETVFSDTGKADEYRTAADQVLNGIDTELYNQHTGLYRIAKFGDGTFQEADLNQWYPGTVAIVWPNLFIDAASPRALNQFSALDSSWDGDPNTDWTAHIADLGGFTWDSIGYAALLAGYPDLSQGHIEMVKGLKFPSFDWPFSVNDAGWLLRTLSSAIPVSIDIKPGSYPNSIYLGSHGNIPVAILGSAVFDASTVDPASVTLASAPAGLKGKANTPMASLEDVNADGLSDLVVHVDTQSLVLSSSDEIALFSGTTLDGRPLSGEDTIRVVP